MKKLMNKKFFMLIAITMFATVVLSACTLFGSRVLTKLTIDTSYAKTSYVIGENFVANGVKVYAIYDGFASEEVTNDAQIDAELFNKYVVGTYAISVSFEDKIIIYNVQVLESTTQKSMSGITLNTTLAQKTFLLGEPFHSDNLIVNLNYSDQTSLVIDEYSVNANAYSTTSAGNFNIIVSFHNFSAHYSVTVINISYPTPDSTSYLDSFIQTVYSKVRTSHAVGAVSVMGNEYSAFALKAVNNLANPYYFYNVPSAQLEASATALASSLYTKINATLSEFNTYFDNSYTRNEIYNYAQEYITALNNNSSYQTFLSNYSDYSNFFENPNTNNIFIYYTYHILTIIKDSVYAPYEYNEYQDKQVSYDAAKNEITITANYVQNGTTLQTTYMYNASTKMIKTLKAPYDNGYFYFNFG